MSSAPLAVGRASSSSSSSSRPRCLPILVVLLSLILLGTLAVLSSATWFFGVPSFALLAEADVPAPPSELPWRGVGRSPDAIVDDDWDGKVQGTESWSVLDDVPLLPGEKMPRIVHQTWRDDVLPAKWRGEYLNCQKGLENYTFHLWTDATSRRFISEVYPSFLPTFDSYRYPIQRADAIRYFVLHRFGGVYLDLDVGCLRDLGPLLGGEWDVILAKTIPVGVSNDIMLSAKGSAFMDMVIHGLITFNHNYVTNYPTVMFSTGPMFLSAQYSLFTSSHPLTPTQPLSVRVLPKALYGKNATPLEAPHAFFSHFYGSSWHSDDADFLLFLGKRGKWVVWAMGGLVLIGVGRVVLGRGRGGAMRRGSVAKKGGGRLTRFVLERTGVAVGAGAWSFPMGGSSSSGSSSRESSREGGGTYHLLSFLPASLAPSPLSSPPNSPRNTTILPLSFGMTHSTASSSASRPNTPPPSSSSASSSAASSPPSAAWEGVRSFFLAVPGTLTTHFTSSSPSYSPLPSPSVEDDRSIYPATSSAAGPHASGGHSFRPSSPPPSSHSSRRSSHATTSSSTGVLYLLPAYFASSSPSTSSSSRPPFAVETPAAKTGQRDEHREGVADARRGVPSGGRRGERGTGVRGQGEEGEYGEEEDVARWGGRRRGEGLARSSLGSGEGSLAFESEDEGEGEGDKAAMSARTSGSWGGSTRRGSPPPRYRDADEEEKGLKLDDWADWEKEDRR